MVSPSRTALSAISSGASRRVRSAGMTVTRTPSSAGSFGDGVQGIGVACNQDEIRAPLSQQVGERGADAARCASDERGRSPKEITHGTDGIYGSPPRPLIRWNG